MAKRKRKPREVLGVPDGASDEQAKRAHRDLVMLHMGRVNEGDQESAEALKEVNEAWAELNGDATLPEMPRQVKVHQEVLACFQATLATVFGQKREPCAEDLVGVMVSATKQKQAALDNDLFNARAQHKKLLAMVGRFKVREGGLNVFEMALKKAAGEVAVVVAGMEEQADVLDGVMEFLEGSEFKYDRPKGPIKPRMLQELLGGTGTFWWSNNSGSGG